MQQIVLLTTSMLQSSHEDSMDIALLEIAVGSVAEAVVIALLLKTSAYRSVPAFFLYLCWGLASDAMLYFARSHCSADAFFHAYLSQLVLDSVLMFAVLVELAWNLLIPIRATLPRHAWLGIAGVIALCALILWPVAGWTLPVNLAPSGAFYFRMQQTFALLRVVVFLVIAAFSQMLALSWRNREMQLATGFGFYSLVSLAVTVLHTHQLVGDQYHWLDVLGSLSYVFVLLYWVVCFASKEAERQDFTPQMRGFLLAAAGVAHRDRVALRKSLRQPRQGGEDS